jgi:hypothetical protein
MRDCRLEQYHSQEMNDLKPGAADRYTNIGLRIDRAGRDPGFRPCIEGSVLPPPSTRDVDG